jgi:hypothetical protein
MLLVLQLPIMRYFPYLLLPSANRFLFLVPYLNHKSNYLKQAKEKAKEKLLKA